jgi:hypothetical protein
MKFSFIVICIALGACSTPEFLSEKELKAYVRDAENGMSKEREFKGYKVNVTYRPNDLLVAQETRGETIVDSVELARLKGKYNNYYYFLLSLSRNNKEAEYQAGGGMGQFSELVQTLSFRMSEYVNLTTSAQDTIPVGDYIYPRTYGMSDASTLMFAFNKEKAKGKEWIQFNMKELGLGIGNMNFRFDTEKLEHTPKIKFEYEREKKHD